MENTEIIERGRQNYDKLKSTVDLDNEMENSEDTPRNILSRILAASNLIYYHSQHYPNKCLINDEFYDTYLKEVIKEDTYGSGVGEMEFNKLPDIENGLITVYYDDEMIPNSNNRYYTFKIKVK